MKNRKSRKKECFFVCRFYTLRREKKTTTHQKKREQTQNKQTKPQKP